MGFRFFRRVKIAPGISLNFSKSGISPSIGVPGARITFGRRGIRRTIGIPGTGLYYTETLGAGKHRAARAAPQPKPEPRHSLDLGFFNRLFTPKDERAFVDGCRAYVADHEADQALCKFRQATHLPDGAFMAGFLALKTGQYELAAANLLEAASQARFLGVHFDKYGLEVSLSLPITEEVAAHITPCERGALLGLVEAYQHQGKNQEALDCLKRLHKQKPDDAVVNLSIAELIYDAAPDDKRLARSIVKVAGDVQNDSEVHAALMLYKARRLEHLVWIRLHGMC